jgi:hypothetical protein
MVLPAAVALSFSENSITTINDSDLQQEVSNAEIKIRAAAALGVFVIKYNATIIGNPAIDPRVFTADLPTLQNQFYSAFIIAGYIVGLDPLTGFWQITWSNFGPETQVLVYSFRTSFNPSGVTARTISAIQTFFGGLVPVVYTDVAYNGFIDEAGFGGSSSTFYEFTVIAGQDSDRTSHATLLKGFLTTQGLGYNSGNCAVYLMTP